MRLHLWLESNQGVYFGIGRVQLLMAIDELGSLRKAADRLGMSYRAAWGKIRATEKAAGVKLLRRRGHRSEGYELTPAGKDLKDKFLRWFDLVEETALREANHIFRARVKGYAAGKKPSRT